MANTIVSTAETLSVNFKPGEDVRFPTTTSESIFTFGNFKLQRASTSETLGQAESTSSFSNFSTIETLSGVTYEPEKIGITTSGELNPVRSDPQSYAYFGSFYTKVATSINNIIDEFPYAILGYNFGTADTITNYSSNTFFETSSFSIPTSALTNQGSVIYVSGASDSGRVITLFDNPEKFAIQFSGNSANTSSYAILSYDYSTGTTGTLNFSIDGLLFTGTTSASTLPIYIRPSQERFGQYKRTITNLEYQLFFDGKFMIPDPDDESTFITETFVWPKTIDGFNPDGSGVDFTEYSDTILRSSQLVDDAKTNWMVRTMLPENFLELDTDTEIYRKITTVYAEEFDNLKKYIDSIAYAHTVTYDGQGNTPDKFLHKLSNLLGFKYNDAFTDSDIFEYLASEDDDGKTLSDYNLELWKKILVSINWLYKKKGTRDAIMFIFKLVGAPDCLVNFNEFVYNVKKTVIDEDEDNPKITDDGYPNYNNSEFIFQEGGKGRGNGQNFINQWSPEFDLNKVVDNTKVQTGDTEFFGTQNVMNTKETEINLVSAASIECDVKDWLELGYGTWLWGSTSTTVSPYEALPLSGLTVPFEWIIDNVYGVAPSSITGMTISQWLDFVYASNVDPRDRKTHGKGQVRGIYHNLKRIYLTYMLWTNGQESNRLTFAKLEGFLDLMERNFFGYIPELVPATTILESATVYKNTVFNRQKFVYPEGINKGSEFQNDIPPQPTPELKPVVLTPIVNDIIHPELKPVVINAKANEILEGDVSAFRMIGKADTGTDLEIDSFTVTMDVNPQEELLILPDKKFIGTPIIFPEAETIVTATTING